MGEGWLCWGSLQGVGDHCLLTFPVCLGLGTLCNNLIFFAGVLIVPRMCSVMSVQFISRQSLMVSVSGKAVNL